MSATTPHQPTRVERATQEVLRVLNRTITEEHRRFHVDISESDFRSMLAAYFTNKTRAEWTEDLRAPG